MGDTSVDQHTHKNENVLGLEELQEVFQALPAALVYADTERRIVKVNTAFTVIFGYQPEEVYGKHTSILYAEEEDYKDQGKARFNTSAKVNTRPYSMKYRRKNGDVFNSETLGTAVRLRSGETVGMLGLISEENEYIQALNQIKASEQRLREIFNQQFQFMAILSPDGIVESINDLVLKYQGVTREDYVGKPFWDAPAWQGMPEWKNTWRKRLKAAKATSKPILTEDIYQISDGSIHHADASTTAIFNESGKCTGFIIQAADTTAKIETQQDLEKQKNLFESYLDTIEAITVVLGTNGTIKLLNPSAEKILGQSADKLIGKNWFTHCLPNPEGLETIFPMFQKMIQNDNKLTKYYENEVLSSDGSRPYVAWHNAVLQDAEGNVTGTISSGHDITAKRKSEEKLRLSASVLENTSEGVLITDKQQRIIEVNNAFSNITGYSRDDVLGQNPSLLNSGRQDEAFYENMWLALNKTGQWSGEIWNRTKSGKIFPEWQSISSVYDDQGELSHYVSVFSDISQIKNSEEKLAFLAHHDALTSLPNRLLLRERLSQAIKHAERECSSFAVIFLDLDHFKLINDSFGHQAGDTLLIDVASALKSTVRETDTISRIGGDEFVILIEDVDQTNLTGILEKITLIFQTPFNLDGKNIRITASLGICLYPEDGTDVELILRNADTAMYKAKERGRNTYRFYSEKLTQKAFERVVLENGLDNAIESNQLCMVYQPQICLKTKKLIGLEALVRWAHPTLGMITPDKFIPLAEESGLIHKLGNWVLRRSCIDAKKWHSKGYDFGRIAINISGHQLLKGGVDQRIIDITSELDLPLVLLEMELTESCLVQEYKNVLPQLLRLEGKGVSIAIDDFGTGYSSLSYLKSLPINKLKIDQSFISEATTDNDSRMIVETIIAMAKNLRLTSIAEGVETEAQAELLSNNGCNEAQGYLYSQPQEEEYITELIVSYQ